MKGSYKVFKGDELIASANNLVTSLGQSQILQYLAGQVQTWGDYVALGTGGSTPSADDTALDFEFIRGPVVSKSVDFVNNRVTIKADVTDSGAGWVYEIGLFPSSLTSSVEDGQAQVLTIFDQINDIFSVGTINTTNYRNGISSLQLTASASATTTSNDSNFAFDLSSYTNNDSFVLSYFTNDTHCATIRIRLKTDNSNYFTYSFTPSSISGYYTTVFNRSLLVATGIPDLSNITQMDIEIVATSAGSTTVQFDGFSAVAQDPTNAFYLISRAVVPTPFYKDENEELNVEYTIEFDVGPAPTDGGSDFTITDNGDGSVTLETTDALALVDNGDGSVSINDA